MKQRRNRKFYSLALFRRIQGTTIRICPIESWFSTTIKREAEREANRINRKNEYSLDAKFVNVEALGS